MPLWSVANSQSCKIDWDLFCWFYLNSMDSICSLFNSLSCPLPGTNQPVLKQWGLLFFLKEKLSVPDWVSNSPNKSPSGYKLDALTTRPSHPYCPCANWYWPVFCWQKNWYFSCGLQKKYATDNRKPAISCSRTLGHGNNRHTNLKEGLIPLYTL